MKRKGTILFYRLFILSISFLLVGCKAQIKIEEKPLALKVKISRGAFVKQEGENFDTFNFINEYDYEGVDTEDKVINNFNLLSNTYTYFRGTNYFINYKDNDIKVEEENVSNFKISPKGNYVFYFANNEYLQPINFNLEENTYELIENKAIISGKFIDWFNDDQLIFYGIDVENKVNGIFTYDIVTKKEALLYEINNGFISFLEYIDGKVYFVQKDFDDNGVLKSIDEEGNIKEVCLDITEISDVEVSDEKIYVLGKIKNNVYSIYEVSTGVAHRIVYDFPSSINIEKGLSINENGELMFMGLTNNKKSEIFNYSDDGIALISKSEGEYNFINVK